MASAAEQLAANLDVGAFQKATELAPASAESKAGLARATALRDFLAAARPAAPAAP